jgi:hypothetical protein
MDYMTKAYNAVAASPKGLAAIELGNKLDLAFLGFVTGPIYQTWQYIGADVGRTTYIGAMETCLDADLIWTRDHPPRKDDLHFKTKQKSFEEGVCAQIALRQAYKIHGYNKVLTYLARHIKLYQYVEYNGK